MSEVKSPVFYKSEWCVLLMLALVRLITMIYVPLGEGTEARYAEMARKMLVTNDWITVWYKTGVPFWGKPPMSIWLSAIAMKFFGISAFIVRLPNFLLSVFILGVLFKVVRYYRSTEIARISVLVLVSSLSFYLLAGAILMDPALLFAIFLSQVSFWYALESGNKLAGYLFFLGLALGLLIKGLLILVLVGGVCCIWVVWQNQWKELWQRIPIITGTIGMLALVAPWYILAEYKTPGFLKYFIIGEHFARFMSTGWQGDKYGSAHAQHFGVIWIYLIIGTLPWSICIITFYLSCFYSWLCGLLSHVSTNSRLGQGPTNQINEVKTWMQYWFLCFIWPLIFFSFARNLIYPYVAPALPAFAILFAEIWHQNYKDKAEGKNFIIFASSIGVGMLGLFIIGLFYPHPAVIYYSQDKMIKLWQTQKDHNQNPIVYWKDYEDTSAHFYARGNVISSTNIDIICKKINLNYPSYWVVTSGEMESFNSVWHYPFKEIAKLNVHPYAEYLLRLDAGFKGSMGSDSERSASFWINGDLSEGRD